MRRALTGFALLLVAAGACADPFATRDQNPFTAVFGIPTPLPSSMPPAGEWSFATDFNWGSTALAQAAGAEALIVDAETREVRLTLGRSLSERMAIQLQIPYRYTGGGTLDNFIDGWHDFFGLPEGARPQLPEDRIRIAYARGGSMSIDIADSSQGLADIALDLGYRIARTSSASAVAWLSVKLPTGAADELTGSGAADVALTIAGERQFGDRWSTFGQASVTWLREGDLLADQQRDFVWSGLAGLGWRALRSLEFKLQLDGHSAAYERTQLDFFSEALVLTVGAEYRFQSGWALQLAVSEDIAVETAPDVVVVIGLKRAARGR